MKLKFEWNDLKNHSNFEKHGVWFEEAETVWDDLLAEELFEPIHSVDEDRFVRKGYSFFNRLLVIVFCERETEGVIRIVSARRATFQERKKYEEGI